MYGLKKSDFTLLVQVWKGALKEKASHILVSLTQKQRNPSVILQVSVLERIQTSHNLQNWGYGCSFNHVFNSNWVSPKTLYTLAKVIG